MNILKSIYNKLRNKYVRWRYKHNICVWYDNGIRSKGDIQLQ